MRDVAVRLKHMDELGVAIQVLYPTLFLIPLTPRPEVELALCRSYNRWLAGIWNQAQERLRWAAVVPLMSMNQALSEARFAKENGACGIFLRGTEGDLLLSDPYFFPLYEEAPRLDLPICIHAANGSPTLYNYYKYESVGFSKFKLNCVGAFHSIVMDRIPDRFPKLRIGFLEISAERRVAALRRNRSQEALPHQRQGAAKQFLAAGSHLRRLRDHRRHSVHRRQARRGQHRDRLRLRSRRQRHGVAGDPQSQRWPAPHAAAGEKNRQRQRQSLVRLVMGLPTGNLA